MSLFGSPSRPWRRIRILGHGSHGVVYLAIYAKPNSTNGIHRQVAVKTALLKDAFFLIKENKIYNAFRDCPEIARCYSNQITTEGGLMHYNLLLEYAPGGTLENVIERTGGLGLPEKAVRVYARMILSGLRCMHEKGYVHCDIKPSNILAFPSDHHGDPTAYQLKLADFGVAKEPEEVVEREKLIGKFRGTPVYNPPEVMGSGIVSPVLDTWSLGCTVVQMIGGYESPWPEYEHLSVEEFACLLVRSSSMTPTIPEFMSEIGKDFLRKCFLRDPKSRWTAEELLGHPYVDELHSNATEASPVQCYYPQYSQQPVLCCCPIL